ncbi:hypothetical protein AXFE_29220 [Acidithrix ferrooxidans]|uniref:Uncharacterized protein n=1 Tax=Acidithrix ferrooxidans TaxID=1280514 RepID=A0A0D8HE68_9ACTN|nr:hypothetical protein AXFE_29220 [Acidithrix ferrooxidans]
MNWEAYEDVIQLAHYKDCFGSSSRFYVVLPLGLALFPLCEEWPMRRAHWNDTVILVWFWQVTPGLKIR